MKKILVPCDFSAAAREAFKFAMSIADQTNGEIIVLNVIQMPLTYDPAMAGGATVGFDPVFLAELEDNIKSQYKKMREPYNALTIKSRLEIVAYGDIVSSIKNTVETEQIDIIIMGATGSSRINEAFIGSVAERVVRRSVVPVLVVRSAPEFNDIKNILLPSLLELNQGEFMKQVKKLQQFFNATLHILLINTPGHFIPNTDANYEFDEFIKHYQLSNYKIHFQNYLYEEDGIIDFAKKQKMDLIAMATHARKGLAHLFIGSLTEDVVNHVNCPIWTFALQQKQ